MFRLSPIFRGAQTDGIFAEHTFDGASLLRITRRGRPWPWHQFRSRTSGRFLGLDANVEGEASQHGVAPAIHESAPPYIGDAYTDKHPPQPEAAVGAVLWVSETFSPKLN
jgi:hypothetical protein